MKTAHALLALALLLPGTARADEPLTAGTGDVPVPKRIKIVTPEYPPEAQAQGLRGIVILEVTVDREGKVVDARVVRSVPPFDDAALAAVRQWQYEPPKVKGQPAVIRFTVPITFALKLPDLHRDAGVPELRSGASPAAPAGAPARSASVRTRVLLDGQGNLLDASVIEGESPWADAVIGALRTWRFMPPADGNSLSFDLRAEFTPAEGQAPAQVKLSAGGVKAVEAAPPAVAAGLPAPPATAPPAATPPTSTPAAPATPVAEEPASAPPVAPPDARPAAPPPTVAPEAVPASAPPVATPVAPPANAPANPPASAPVAAPARPGANPHNAAQPPTEVITAPPRPGATGAPAAPATPPPPQPAVSAVRDVQIADGLPDLAKGRRPVPPPLARMQKATGLVTVRFSVDAAGSTQVQEATGPDLLAPAAREVVQSWSFRRRTPERVYLVATFTYEAEKAHAQIRPAE